MALSDIFGNTPTSGSSGTVAINPVTGKPYTASEMLGSTVGNIGNLFNLPEGGWSEKIAPSAWAAENDPQKKITQTMPVNSPVYGPAKTPDTSGVNQNNLASMFPGYAGWDPAAAWQDYLKTGGSGKGGNSGGGSGGSGGGNPVPRPDLNLASQMGGTDTNSNNYWDQVAQAANEGNQSYIDSLNNQYDKQQADLYSQRDTATNNKDLTLSDILNSLNTTQTGIDKQKIENNQSIADETARAGQAAQGTQRTNRNVLRALGILNSTYSADALQKPMNEFDQERNRLTNIGIQNISKLDDAFNQAKQEAQSQKDKVIYQFNEIVGKINSDIRFSERERTAALNASRAALKQRIADIQGQKFNYEQQANQLRQTFITDLAKIQASANPTQANISNILKSIAFTSPTGTTQQAQIFNGTADQRKKLTGEA